MDLFTYVVIKAEKTSELQGVSVYVGILVQSLLY